MNNNNTVMSDNFYNDEQFQGQPLLSNNSTSFITPNTQTYVTASTTATPPQSVILVNNQQRQLENHSSTALLLCLLGCFLPTIGPIFHCIGCCFYANNEDMDESTKFWGKFSCAALVFYGVMIALSVILLVIFGILLLAVPGLLALILSSLHITTQ